MRPRIWDAQGNFGEVLDWVREQGLSTSDEFSYLNEFEHITLVGILLALLYSPARSVFLPNIPTCIHKKSPHVGRTAPHIPWYIFY